MRKNLNQRGSAILIVMMLMSALFLGVTAFYTTIESNDSSASALFRQKQNFYVAEGTRSISVALTHKYLNETRTPTSLGLTTLLREQLPLAIPNKYTADNVNAEIVSTNNLAPIPNGPFAGMMAPQSTVRLSYDVHTENDDQNRNLTHIDATSSLAQVGLFQFMYFIDLEYSDFAPGPPMTIDGRVHVNGNVCIGGQGGLIFSKLTASGKINHINRGPAVGCINDVPTSSNVSVASTSGLADPVRLTTANGNGCTNCAGSGLPWAQYALQAWGGNVMDQAHGVSRLSLPLPAGSRAQYGADSDAAWARTNDRNLRFLVDPVRPGESEEISKMKFAAQADVRIIDGIWYLRDPRDDLRWPGVPIWSDHPGTFTIDGLQVGQQQLRNAWQMRNPWPTAHAPRKFSHYEYDTVTESIRDDGSGVISYGTLARVPNSDGDARWRPGFWISSASNNLNLCRSNPTGGTPGAFSVVQPDSTLVAPAAGVYRFDATNLACTGVVQPNQATYLLNGTRSGFRDGHIFLNHQASDRVNRSKILPMNFDAEAFQAALDDNSSGELGSYFGASRFMGRAFNGIVYITTTYPGSESGYDPVGRGGLAPIQGASTSRYYNGGTPRNILVTSTNQQHAIPYNLCSDTLAVSSNTGGALRPFDGSNRFVIPLCSHYDTVAAQPTAVRIINGAGLLPDKFPRGLSLVSNQSVYVTGSFNTKSNVTAGDSVPWMSSLIAGDQVTFQSDAWDDAGSEWSTNPTPRVAQSSRYNLALVTGWLRASGSVPLHSIPTVMENWQNSTLDFNGSIVAGYYPVYYRSTRRFLATTTYVGGPRNVRFDPHYGNSANQPPGSPLFYINQVLDWKAR